MVLAQEPPLRVEPHWVQPGAWTTTIDTLDASVQAALELDPQVAATGELGECLVRLQAIKNRLVAVETTMAGVFDRSQEWRADGSKSLAGWLAARTKTSRKVLDATVRLAKRLRVMPRTRDALALGAIDQSRAEALGRLAYAARNQVRDAFQDKEADLVAMACDLDEDQLARALAYWRDAADPDGGEDQADKDHANRRVHLSQSIGDNWFLDGQLDPIAGAEVDEALRRISKELFKADWKLAKAVHGDDTREEHLARTPAQRRADALVEMARRAMATPKGARKPRPLVSILCGYESFNGPVRELFNSTVVSPGQIGRLLTEADIERIVYDTPSRNIADLGRTRRFFTAAQRRVIEVQHRVCFHLGCNESAERSQMDHKDPWVPHGLTNISNGRPGCDKHNNDRNKAPPHTS
jgi:hypothetical protein